MAIDELARHHLYLRLEEHLGAEAAETLMEHLPPTGWSEVATKRDLDHLRALTTSDIERMGDRLRAEFHKSIATQTITIVFATIASNAAAVFAVAQLR
jgi:hypothetical protein